MTQASRPCPKCGIVFTALGMPRHLAMHRLYDYRAAMARNEREQYKPHPSLVKSVTALKRRYNFIGWTMEEEDIRRNGEAGLGIGHEVTFEFRMHREFCHHTLLARIIRPEENHYIIESTEII